jgi:cytochrome b561
MAQTETIDHRTASARIERTARYAPALQMLHWLTAALMFAIIPIGWVMESLPGGTTLRPLLFDIHKSIGVTILGCAMARLALRSIHPAPPLTGRLGAVEGGVARASHLLLYAVLLAMPVSGYLISADGVHSFAFFGLFTVPHLPKSAWMEGLGERIHLLGQWAAYGLIALHLAATAWHVAIRRDGILDRMLPPQRPRNRV